MLILSRKLVGEWCALSLDFPQPRVFSVCQDFQKICYYLWKHPAMLWLHCVTYSLSLETKVWIQSLLKSVRIFPLTPAAPGLGFCNDKRTTHEKWKLVTWTLIYVSSNARPNDLKVLLSLRLKNYLFSASAFDTAFFQKCYLLTPAWEQSCFFPAGWCAWGCINYSCRHLKLLFTFPTGYEVLSRCCNRL